MLHGQPLVGREYVEKKIKAICEWKKIEILEMTIIPPKLAISEVMGILIPNSARIYPV
jgi:REP element-mobilizing transposase RayT